MTYYFEAVELKQRILDVMPPNKPVLAMRIKDLYNQKPHEDYGIIGTAQLYPWLKRLAKIGLIEIRGSGKATFYMKVCKD